MAFDSLITKGLVNELNDTLSGGRVLKIYHPDNNDVVLHVHNNQKKWKLLLSIDSSRFGAYLTEDTFDSPKNPTSFCMFLRKHISGAIIKSFSQHSWDRIIEINFLTKDEMGYQREKTLIVEIMGKHSNLILIDTSSQKILDALKKLSLDSNSIRQIFPSIIYAYPPVQEKLSPEDFSKNNFDTRGKKILDFVYGISSCIANSIELSNKGSNILKEILLNIKNNNLDIAVYMDEQNLPVDFHIVPLEIYSGYKKINFKTISEAINFYYKNKTTSNRLVQKSRDTNKSINNLLKKLYKKHSKLLNELEVAKNSDYFKVIGELITANIHNISMGQECAKLFNYYTGEYLTVDLNSNLSPSNNAQNYFKKYNKSKRAIIEKEKQIKSTLSDINFLENSLAYLNMAENLSDIDVIREDLIEAGYLKSKTNLKFNNKNSKSKSENHLKFITTDGFSVLVGRSNKENDLLTTKIAKKNDIWLHTKDIHGSHIILQSNGKSIPNTSIKEAASLAAYYSKARDSENVPVDYTLIKYVKKPKGAKSGMVIFTNNKTIYVNPYKITLKDEL